MSDAIQDNTAIAALAASKQKNCNSCVQSKRRCDRRTPACSRCAEKNMPCSYTATKTKGVSRSDKQVVKPAELPSIGTAMSPSIFVPEMALNMDYLGLMPMDAQTDNDAFAATTTQPLGVDDASNIDIPMDTFLNMIGNSTSPTWQQWLVPLDQGQVTERPGTPVDEEAMTAYDKMSPFCDNIEPWHLYDSKTPLHFVVGRVKAFTTDFASRNATPFLHKYLYRDHTPQCMLSCFTTNVLYANRTQTNTAMVMRALQASVRELIDAEAGRVVATPTEKLARTQSLFLYQIIRLFDGDVMLRAQGEKDMPLLETWLGDLCKIREHLGDLAQLENSLVRKQNPKEWGRWIFAESVRRTIIMAYSVAKVYEMMTESDGEDDPGPWAYFNRWTLSRHLWEADSSYEFERMWKEKPQFIINNYSFAKFLEHGRGEDVDEFAEILLSVYMGVDATKEFIYAQESKTMGR